MGKLISIISEQEANRKFPKSNESAQWTSLEIEKLKMIKKNQGKIDENNTTHHSSSRFTPQNCMKLVIMIFVLKKIDYQKNWSKTHFLQIAATSLFLKQFFSFLDMSQWTHEINIINKLRQKIIHQK